MFNMFIFFHYFFTVKVFHGIDVTANELRSMLNWYRIKYGTFLGSYQWKMKKHLRKILIGERFVWFWSFFLKFQVMCVICIVTKNSQRSFLFQKIWIISKLISITPSLNIIAYIQLFRLWVWLMVQFFEIYNQIYRKLGYLSS